MDVGAPTVLLIEDDPNDQLLLQRAFRKAGIVVTINLAVHGDAAIAALDGPGMAPTLVLLDLKLPGRSGFEVLAWLKSHEQLRRIPVIVFTSSADASDIQRAYDLGANSFLVKPGNSEELQALATTIAHYWFSLNRSAPL
jgi:CheY-like chemotaxis protein